MGELKFEIEEDAADQVVDPKEQAWRAVEEDRKVVEAEILAYEAAGILDENHPESKDFYLLGYWQVLFQRSLLFRIHTVVTVKAGYLSML